MPDKTSGDLQPQLLKRAVASGTIPNGARGFPDTDIKTFRMRAYTLAAELDAAKIAATQGDTQAALTIELVRRCVFEIDGAPVKDPTWLDEQSPQVRAFLTVAMNRLTGISKEDQTSFLETLQIGVE